MSTIASGALSATERRRRLRAGLASGRIQRYPGAFSPLVARLVTDLGFEGIYVSGAALSADLALPDIGLTTLSEVVDRGRQIAGASDLPVLIDADTGFGEPLNAARTIWALKEAGIAGCHIEDQVNPKRCGHLDNKSVVDTATMVRRLRAAVAARRDPEFVICARTDARATEGLDAAIERARAYVAAGADLIFPEALADEGEFATFRRSVDAPILANMTEFGRTPLIEAERLEAAGVSLVIYPVTTLRLAMGAVEEGLRRTAAMGTQSSLVPAMQTRARLYELLRYEDYTRFDSDVFDFRVPTHPSKDSR